MALSAGEKLGPYVILAPIGAGGMGEVYRAHDTKLDRDVAIKVLPAALAQNPERLARFEREAKVLAALNHPNIAAIYGLAETESNARAIIMELVEGPTLADRLASGALPLEEALKIASQIADALEAAHDKGIVHRDLKPANVKVRDDGTVKVLDFGLATAVQSSSREGGDGENSPTLTMGATEAGVILGTAAYMAPEQARGQKVDKRADIWAFGVVLYEMLTGERLFRGGTVSDVLAQVLTKEPDVDRAPAKARKLLRRCLDKDPKQRLRDIGEARFLLELEEEVAPAVLPPVTAPGPGGTPSRLGWLLAATVVLALGFAAVSFIHFRETPSALPSGRFDVTLPEKSRLSYFMLSPDGRNLAVVSDEGGPDRIWVRPLDSLESRQIPGTDGATYPFWSPDGANLGFFAQGKLKKIALAGGPAQTLCDAPTPRGGSWNRDGVIVFAPTVTGGLYRISEEGGVPTPLTKPAGSGSGDTHRYPEFILGGRRFLFDYQVTQPETAGIYVGSLDGAPPVRVLPDASRALYVPPAAGGRTGYLLFVRERTLMALPFDPDKLRAAGNVTPVADVMNNAGANTGFGPFSASENGVMLYRSGDSIQTRTLVWLDRSGKQLEVKSEPKPLLSPALSPDGKHAAISMLASQVAGDIWLQDLERGVPTKFTFDAGRAEGPVWSPDGSYIVFLNRTGVYDFYSKPANSAGKEELLLHGGNNAYPYDISPDGKFLVYSETEANTKDDLWLLPLQGDHKPEKYLSSPFEERLAQFSPDGKWMAYASDDSGQFQVYVQPIPATGAKRQISTMGGSRPRWRRDGRELFYISADLKLMAVPVKLGATTFDFGAPKQLFDKPLAAGNSREFGYQPSADGQKFLALVAAEGETAALPPVTVWLNWQASLKK